MNPPGLLWRGLWGLFRPPGPRSPLVGAAHTDAAKRVWVVVRVIYAYNFAIAFRFVAEWRRWQGDPVLDPLWPVSWFAAVGSSLGAALVLGGFLVVSLLVLVRVESRTLRGLCCGLGLMAFALQNSLGKVNHGYHALVWCLFVLVFLPALAGDTQHLRRRFHHRSLRVFWVALAAPLMFYSLSGALKVYAGINQALRGEVGFFAPSAAAHHVAHRLLQTDGRSLLGPWLLEHSWVGGLTQWLTLYLEVASLFVAFRPPAHRLWAAGLLSMHIGIGLFMNIWFSHHIAVVALVLGCSPFTAPGTTLRQSLLSLPVVAELVQLVRRSQRRSSGAPNAKRQAGSPSEERVRER